MLLLDPTLTDADDDVVNVDRDDVTDVTPEDVVTPEEGMLDEFVVVKPLKLLFKLGLLDVVITVNVLFLLTSSLVTALLVVVVALTGTDCVVVPDVVVTLLLLLLEILQVTVVKLFVDGSIVEHDGAGVDKLVELVTVVETLDVVEEVVVLAVEVFTTLVIVSDEDEGTLLFVIIELLDVDDGTLVTGVDATIFCCCSRCKRVVTPVDNAISPNELFAALFTFCGLFRDDRVRCRDFRNNCL